MGWELLLLEVEVLNGGSQMEDTADLLLDAHLDGLLDQGHALSLLSDIDWENLDLSVELVTQDSQLAGLVASSHAILRGEDDSSSTVLNSPLEELKAESAQTAGDDVGLERVEDDLLGWESGQNLLRRGGGGQLVLTTVDDRSDLGRWEHDWLDDLSLEARWDGLTLDESSGWESLSLNESWDDGLTLDESWDNGLSLESSGWDNGLTLDESGGWDNGLTLESSSWENSLDTSGVLNWELEWVANWEVGHVTSGGPWLLTTESALEGRQSRVWESRSSDEWEDSGGWVELFAEVHDWAERTPLSLTENVHDQVSLADDVEELNLLGNLDWHLDELGNGWDHVSSAIEVDWLTVSNEEASDLLSANLASQLVDHRDDLEGWLTLAQEPNTLDLLLEESASNTLDPLTALLSDVLIDENLLLAHWQSDAQWTTVQEHARELNIGLHRDWVETALLNELTPLHLALVLLVWESTSGVLEWSGHELRQHGWGAQNGRLLQLVQLRQQVERVGVLVDEQETFYFLNSFLVFVFIS